MRSLFQAAVDFGFDAYDYFYQSSDEVQNIAEDISREMMDKIGGYRIDERILGNVDYRKARYVILPDLQVRQALFVESKAEKDATSATLQMSETSMVVNQDRAGQVHNVAGLIPKIAMPRGLAHLTTTLVAHFHYEDHESNHILKTLTMAALPNGRLQQKYNPDTDDTIWKAGRNAPKLGETFRVRLAFDRLETKSAWRVQRIAYEVGSKQIGGEWTE
jgi:hypothetical protein